MIDHVWSVLCWRTSTDHINKNISLFDVVEEITLSTNNPIAEDGAILPIELTVASLWIRSDDDVPGMGWSRIQFQYPSGQKLDELEVEINLSNHLRSRGIAKIQGLRIKGEGRYSFSIQLLQGEEWEEVARIPLHIRIEHRQPEQLEEDDTERNNSVT